MTEARTLIGAATYGPETLRRLFAAFDEAWEVIAPRYGDDQPAIAVARLTLANIVLGLARDGTHDIGVLRDAALAHFDQSGSLRPPRPGAQG